MSTEQQMMTKGCEVEVCSQEEGLEGVWFRAVLEENPTKTGRKKLSVRYVTLLSDDGSSPLTETVLQSLVRPVPPEEEYIGVVLEEGTVVDAEHRDGWWTGVVINNKLEDDNYLVYFDSPPDIIKFEKNKLRARVDWTGSKWVRPELKELDKSMFCPGTMVEVSSVTGKSEVAWFPAMLIKEIEVGGDKKFIVKDCNQHLSRYGEEARPNTTVDRRRVRPTPPPFSAEEYKLLECVEAFHGSVWRGGFVMGILSSKCYMVSLEATKEEHVFSHSHVRPFKVWEDEAWHDGPKRKPAVKETPSSVIKTKPVRSSSGAEPLIPKRARKHVRRSLNPEENGETLTKAETVAATGELRMKSDDTVMIDETPPLITPQGKSTEVSCDESPNVMLNSAAATYVEETPTLMALPFAKKSPYWKRCESTESYKSVPQRPHFSPLLEARDDIREWSAVGMMVTFYGLLEEVKDLKPDDSSSIFSSLSDSFAELEKHGFDIDAPQSRIKKMLSIKEERAKKAEEKQCFENKIVEVEKESRKLEEEMAELKRKAIELQRREAVAKEEKEAADKRIVDMKSTADRIVQEIEDAELEFTKTVSAPW